MSVWQTCPQCGEKLQGYNNYLSHLQKHPGLKEREAIRKQQSYLDFAQKRLREFKEIKTDLTNSQLSPLSVKILLASIDLTTVDSITEKERRLFENVLHETEQLVGAQTALHMAMVLAREKGET